MITALPALLGFSGLLALIFVLNVARHGWPKRLEELRAAEPLCLPASMAQPSDDDKQWLSIFRETVLETDGTISPFLDKHLSAATDFNAVHRQAESIVKEANEQAALICGQAESRAQLAAEDARKQAIAEIRRYCAKDSCKDRPDPRCGAGLCGHHCLLNCPPWCRSEGHARLVAQIRTTDDRD